MIKKFRRSLENRKRETSESLLGNRKIIKEVIQDKGEGVVSRNDVLLYAESCGGKGINKR